MQPRNNGSTGNRQHRTSGHRRSDQGQNFSRQSRSLGADSRRHGDTDRPARKPKPALPYFDEVDPRDLDPVITAELRSLSKTNAEQVARHLVAAGLLLDDDPQLALQHARAARATAARIAAVREAVGIAAYVNGEWTEALAELRTVHRLTGNYMHLALIADCERALGRPEKSLDVIRSAKEKQLTKDIHVELQIVESGVRRDLGQIDAAVLALEGPYLQSSTVEPWTVRLWYAYADALLHAKRSDEAVKWFRAAAAIDEDNVTDAESRLHELANGQAE